MNQDKKLSSARINSTLNQLTKKFNSSIEFDYKLYEYDIKGSIAYSKALYKANILTTKEQQDIEETLINIKENIKKGKFKFSVEQEDIHMNIEAELIKQLGETGKKLHTGRSRNDQITTDIRLYLIDESIKIKELLISLLNTLIIKSEQNLDCIMPGFTHLQPAQPILFSHYLLAYVQMLTRDLQRLKDLQPRLKVLPLGSGALAGSGYSIDRTFLTQELGFLKPSNNSIDAVSDRDFAIEFLNFSVILFMHLSRFMEEIIIYSSVQFNFIELSDSFCTGSSIMPQKKNPDIAELIRGKTGRIYGNLFNLLTLMKSQPLAYNKDNQEDKEPIFDTVKNINTSLQLLIPMLKSMQINKSKMLNAALAGYTTATDLADYLVKQGLSFRDAHFLVGKIVNYAIKNKVNLEEISIKKLQNYSPLIKEDVYDFLSLEGSIALRNIFGGTGRNAVLKQIFEIKNLIKSF